MWWVKPHYMIKMDEDTGDGKKTRLMYFVSGALLGGVLGAIVDQPLAGSGIGMVVGVIMASKKEE